MIGDKNMINKTNCNQCEFRKDCAIRQTKMYKGECYIDEIAEKLKIKKRDVYKAIESYTWLTGLDTTANSSDDFVTWWCKLTESEKKRFFENKIETYIEKMKNLKYCEPDNTYEARLAKSPFKPNNSKIVRVMVAIFNFAYDAWRDSDTVRCMECGKWIENNSKHNRKYCEKCAKKMKNKPKPIKSMICMDCGIEYSIEPKDTRSCRCGACQMEADKKATRIRVARYREKKKAEATA